MPLSPLHLFLLFCHSCRHVFFLLSHFRPITLVFLTLLLPILSSATLAGKVSVFHQAPVSATFQLACIPASGCVEDKMELIPPGYCYLCFLPVAHQQSYTFTHTHKENYMSTHQENARAQAPSVTDALKR